MNRKRFAENAYTITSLNYSSATFSASATSWASFTATANIPHNGGNGVAYAEGTAVASTGVTGLTATLLADTLSNGSGAATFVITGTSSTANTSQKIVYLLSGTATKGSFKIYSEYKFNITLKGISITNSEGPSINSQSSKKNNYQCTGTNTLVDGTTYATSSED